MSTPLALFLSGDMRFSVRLGGMLIAHPAAWPEGGGVSRPSSSTKGRMRAKTAARERVITVTKVVVMQIHTRLPAAQRARLRLYQSGTAAVQLQSQPRCLSPRGRKGKPLNSSLRPPSSQESLPASLHPPWPPQFHLASSSAPSAAAPWVRLGDE